MSEIYDIVDRDDNVIGQAAYDDARANNKIIRVVHNWIIGSDGRILFQFRGAHKKSYPRHFDASTGGRVDAGEDYDTAVIRETREELGIDTSPVFVGKIFQDEPHEYKFISVYYTYHDGPFSGWEAEAEHLEWMSIRECHALSERFPYLFCGMPSLQLLIDKLEGNK